MGVLVGVSEAGREGDEGAEELLDLVRERTEQRSVEEPRRDAADADALQGKGWSGGERETAKTWLERSRAMGRVMAAMAPLEAA